jgi:hypothetical protein
MLRWDALGETRVTFGVAMADGADPRPGGAFENACAALGACTLALVVHDFHRAGVLGTATLLRARGRPILLTAGHLFDAGARLGNMLVPLAAGHGFVCLAGARVRRCADADIAIISLDGVAGAASVLEGRRPAGVPQVSGHRRRHRHRAREGGSVLVSGYPAALSRFERGWLGARRFTMVTCPVDASPAALARGDRLFDYGRIACRADGVPIRTPELQGMSGAGIWSLEGAAGPGAARLRLLAVQSSFMHGRFVRGHDVRAIDAFLRQG